MDLLLCCLVDGDGSVDSCESSGEEEVIHKPKPLQARKSILEISESSSKLEEPPAKRAKRDDTAVSNQIREVNQL